MTFPKEKYLLTPYSIEKIQDTSYGPASISKLISFWNDNMPLPPMNYSAGWPSKHRTLSSVQSCAADNEAWSISEYQEGGGGGGILNYNYCSWSICILTRQVNQSLQIYFWMGGWWQDLQTLPQCWLSQALCRWWSHGYHFTTQLLGGGLIIFSLLWSSEEFLSECRSTKILVQNWLCMTKAKLVALNIIIWRASCNSNYMGSSTDPCYKFIQIAIGCLLRSLGQLVGNGVVH